jgi:CRP-like cAMP-binding protein
MKPENLMLSSENASDAAVKVVDFGCSHLIDREKDKLNKRPNSNTPAYSPPEILDQKDTVNPLEPSFDMWAMGVIIYIMLTGMHPFDPHGNSSEAEIAASILSNKKLTLRNSPMTAHLSPDAVDVIEMLMNRDPAARSSALELLQNPWVLGEKASTQKMVGSDKRLNAYREFKTKLEAKVFADMLTWSENNDPNDMAKRTSLIERFFQNLNPDSNGFVAASDLRKVTRHQESGDEEDDKLSLSGFSNLLAENMKNVYFEKGSQVYREGEEGHAMYFINSGSVEEVYTRDGFNKTVRTAGDFFGEGALMNPSKMRVDSIQCVTPVHAIEISREYFDKYLLTEEGAVLNLREKDRDRKRQRAKQILALQMSLKQKTLKKGDYIFKKGDGGNDFFISESGEVGLSLDGNKLVTLGPDQFIGEHALLFNRRRNCTAQCLSDECNLQVVNAREFYALLDSNPTVRESMTDLSYRREFLKAVALRTKTEFSRKDLRTEAELKVAFDKVVSDSKTGAIDLAEIRSMIKDFDSGYNEADVKSILSSVDLNNSGSVTWDEFVHIFRMSPDKK